MSTSEGGAQSPARPMQCFEWQSRAADFLDGTLLGPLKQQADQHLASCESCSSRHKHFRSLLSEIAAQPRATLPAHLRKAPFSAIIPPTDVARSTRSRWERVPWFVRTTLEGTSIVLLILLGISIGPKLRQFYERRIEQSINEFGDSMSVAEEANDLPLARGKVQAPPAEGTTREDEFSGENEEEADEVASEETSSGDNLKVGNSEIWRFNLKTDSPHEVRPRIVQALRDLRVPADTPGFAGIEAPGGIQFDLFLNKGIILELKRQLQRLAPKPGERSADASIATDGFTWYKNKSKRKIPEGKTRVVIWLSQM
ncbi:MAG TPA: zf-HC2 domain-containing protein [Bdellovibrionota bacterium]|nr:zf-HC2 domain-containing protein [Bdellovibrionota bacterium]